MCSIQAPRCWMTFATLTLKLSMTLSKTSFGILLISLLMFSQLCLDCLHTLSPLGSPRGNSPGGLDQGSKAAMDCRSFSKLNGLLESIGGGIEGCGPNSGVVHHPVEKQLYPNQTLFSSLVPE